MDHDRDGDDYPDDAEQELGAGDPGPDDEQRQQQRVQAARAEPADKRPRRVAHGGLAQHDPYCQRAGDEDHDGGQDERGARWAHRRRGRRSRRRTG